MLYGLAGNPPVAPSGTREHTPRSAQSLSVEELRTFFDAAPFGVLAIGPDGVIEYVNARQCENSRLPREFFLGKDYRVTFGPTIEHAGLLGSYDRLVERGEPFESTVLDYKRHVDGAKIAFSLRGYRVGRWILLVTGVEQVLADQQARYLQLFENANDGIFILSRDGRFTAANRKFSEMVGVSLEELIGQTTELFLPGRFAQSLDRLEQILREGHLGPYELEVSTPNGTKFMSLNGFALLKDGRPVGVINIARDTTQERKAAEDLRVARDKAVESSDLKSSFLANASHEIRTPLNVMLGYASLLAELAKEAGSADQLEMVEGMRRAGERLEATIDSILDISKIESGVLDLRPERIELATVVGRQIRDFQPLAGAKGLTLACKIDEPNAAVSFDPYCLGNALMNLVANAVKFTPSGEVRIELSRDLDRNLCLRVCDTGVGIAPTFLPRVGEPFAQEESGFTRRFDGTGLGLALTKRYLELNGARLSVESEKGKGSVVTIHFSTELAPRAVEASPVSSERVATSLVERVRSRVLVVDDDEETRGYMGILLGKSYEPLLATSAEEALGVLATSDVDVVLMDVSLGGSEDGLALTKRIRSDGRWKNLPIIALTAHAFLADRLKVLEAGCDDYLAKPFNPRELAARISTLLSRRVARESDPAA
jgi:PAS domain S-box-containing protein